MERSPGFLATSATPRIESPSFPADGAEAEMRHHSGYTPARYRSLTRQIALWQSRYGIPASRVTTHQAVDRSGTRRDPRSFAWKLLAQDLRNQRLACSLQAPVADKAGAVRPMAKP